MRKLNANFYGFGAAMLWLGVMTMAGVAQAAAPASRNLGVVKAGAGQPRLELRRVGSFLEAAVCAPACAWSKAVKVTLESPFAEAEAAFSALELGANHRAGLVTLSAAERKYQWLVAAPLAPVPAGPPVKRPSGAQSSEPGDVSVLFAGEVGLSEGEAPDRNGSVVEVIAGENGATSVVVGNVQEDVSLCGRQAVLAPKVVHPDTLTLRGIKFQRVPRAEREAAATLPLLPRTSQLSSRVLNPLLASSGSNAPGLLADDDVGTVWTEGRGGTGGGEFVVMRAPSALGLTGLTFSLPEKSPASYAPPDSFWVVTDTSVFRAVAASDPKNDGAREWHLAFPSPVHTTCVALALDSAKDLGPDTQVGWAEVGATTDIDEARLAGALADLDTGGDQATAAEQLLQDVGREAFQRVKKRYEHYSESGRMRALNVMDAAPCQTSVDIYATALNAEGTAEGEHGKRGLARCKPQAISVLTQKLEKAGSERARVLASTLIQVDPVAALDAMVPLLDGGSRAKRHVLKLALEHAVQAPPALQRAKVLLSAPELTSRRGLFLLRGLGTAVAQVQDVAIPRLRTWIKDVAFDTQYLALEPMARLASADPALEVSLQKIACCSKEPALRAEAARLLPNTPLSTRALLTAIDDPHVRVREAAIVNAGEHAVAAVRPALVRRLQQDSWPFVRSAAARALGQMPAEGLSARALADAATDDASPNVRRPALFVLGTLNAKSELEHVRDAFADDVDADVRAAAAGTLGLLCDSTMVDPLTDAALKLASLASTEGERVIAQASLHALGRLAPSDLRGRLAPFFTKGVLQTSKMAAEAALAHTETCRAATP